MRKAYALMAVSLRESEGPEAALAAVDEGLEVVGVDPELLFHRGLLLSRLGRHEEAVEAYLAMPLDASQWFTSLDVGILGFKRAHNLGEACMAAGRYGEAVGWWREALRESPGFLASAEAMLEAGLQAVDPQATREACEAARRADGPGEIWASMELRRRTALGEDSLQALAQMHQADRGARGPALLLARELLARGDEGSARALLEALEAWGCAEAAFHLGVMDTRRGDLEGALRWMRRARDLDPSHAQTLGQVAALEEALARRAA